MSYNWTRLTTDQVVSKVACNLGAVVVTPNGDSKKGNIVLYDGESTSDLPIITIRTGTGVTKTVRFTPPLLCRRGLYVDLGSHVDECLVQWEPLTSH